MSEIKRKRPTPAAAAKRVAKLEGKLAKKEAIIKKMEEEQTAIAERCQNLEEVVVKQSRKLDQLTDLKKRAKAAFDQLGKALEEMDA